MMWKIHLFVSCVKMDVKNHLLQRRIKKARKRAEVLKSEIRARREPVIYP